MSWNVAGWETTVKAIRKRHGTVADWLEKHRVDILCLQETKTSPESIEGQPMRVEAQLEGWETLWSCNAGKGGQRKGLNGVATYCRRGLVSGGCCRPLAEQALDDEGRCLRTDHGGFVIFNVYAPNTANAARVALKLQFLEKLSSAAEAQRRKGKRVLIVGDLNISPGKHDVHWKRKAIPYDTLPRAIEAESILGPPRRCREVADLWPKVVEMFRACAFVTKGAPATPGSNKVHKMALWVPSCGLWQPDPPADARKQDGYSGSKAAGAKAEASDCIPSTVGGEQTETGASKIGSEASSRLGVPSPAGTHADCPTDNNQKQNHDGNNAAVKSDPDVKMNRNEPNAQVPMKRDVPLDPSPVGSGSQTDDGGIATSRVSASPENLVNAGSSLDPSSEGAAQQLQPSTKNPSAAAAKGNGAADALTANSAPPRENMRRVQVGSGEAFPEYLLGYPLLAGPPPGRPPRMGVMDVRDLFNKVAPLVADGVAPLTEKEAFRLADACAVGRHPVDVVAWFAGMVGEGGFIDAFREDFPDEVERFTCWDQSSNMRYQNCGSRIDFTLIDASWWRESRQNRATHPSPLPQPDGSDRNAAPQDRVQPLPTTPLQDCTANFLFQPAPVGGGGIPEAPTHAYDHQFRPVAAFSARPAASTGIIYTPPEFSDHVAVSIRVAPPDPQAYPLPYNPTASAETRACVPHKNQTTLAGLFRRVPAAKKVADASNACSKSNPPVAVVEISPDTPKPARCCKPADLGAEKPRRQGDTVESVVVTNAANLQDDKRSCRSAELAKKSAELDGQPLQDGKGNPKHRETVEIVEDDDTAGESAAKGGPSQRKRARNASHLADEAPSKVPKPAGKRAKGGQQAKRRAVDVSKRGSIFSMLGGAAAGKRLADEDAPRREVIELDLDADDD
eukprot:gene16497-25296_t